MGLVSCANVSNKNDVLESIRTDGIYVSKDTNKDGTKISLKFYNISKNGKEEMRVVVSGLNSAMPEVTDQSEYDTWFIVSSTDNAIQYRIKMGNMGISIKHRFADYDFIKE
ncbi:MAG: hypothetical protein ACN4GM_04280 [Gammaproteobacteria bacterium]